MKPFLSVALFVCLFVPVTTLNAQLTGIAINDNGVKADTSAILDVNVNSSSAKRGFLLPRITSIQRDAIYLPAKGLMVYITNVDSLEINIGTPIAPIWSSLSIGSNWLLAGNTGTTPGANFIGTTDAKDFVTKTNNTERLRVSSLGHVGIGTTAPGSALDVQGTIRLTGSTSGFVGFSPAAAAGSTTYTLPTADGPQGFQLSTNGSGVLSWMDARGATTNTLTSSINTLTSTVNGFDASAPAVNSVSNNSFDNNLTTTVNGVSGNPVNIINTNVLGINGSNLITSTINGVPSNSLDISSAVKANAWALPGNASTTASTSAIGTKANNNFIGTTDAKDWVAATSGYERFRITQSGNIGIQNTAPSALLDIKTSTAANAVNVTTGNVVNITANGLTSGNGLNILSNSTAGVADSSSALINLARSGANAAASHTAYGIKSTIINIGTTSTNIAGYFSATGATNNYPLVLNGVPGGTLTDSVLSINTTNGVVRTFNTNRFALAGTDWLITGNTGTIASSSAIGSIANNNFIGTNDANDFVMVTNQKERMRIKQGSGYVGIGTVTPRAVLDVTKDSINKGIVVLQNTNAAGYSSVDMMNQTGTLSATFGFGNSGTNNIFAGNGYFNSYSNNFVMLSSASGNANAATPPIVTINGKNFKFGANLFFNGSDSTVAGNVGIGTMSPSINVALAIANGHLQSQQRTPPGKTNGASAQIGSTGTVTLSNATDVAGKISIATSGTAPSAAGTLITVAFIKAYATAPIVQLQATSAASAGFAVYVTSTTTGFTITNTTTLANNTTYAWGYTIIETL